MKMREGTGELVVSGDGGGAGADGDGGAVFCSGGPQWK